MALVQVNVPDDVKTRADEAFARNGITTPGAMRMMITQVANTGVTPFDGVFSGLKSKELTEDIYIDTLREEAKEYGIIPDDAHDATKMSQDILDILGVSTEEVHL